MQGSSTSWTVFLLGKIRFRNFYTFLHSRYFANGYLHKTVTHFTSKYVITSVVAFRISTFYLNRPLNNRSACRTSARQPDFCELTDHLFRPTTDRLPGSPKFSHCHVVPIDTTAPRLPWGCPAAIGAAAVYKFPSRGREIIHHHCSNCCWAAPWDHRGACKTNAK